MEVKLRKRILGIFSLSKLGPTGVNCNVVIPEGNFAMKKAEEIL